MSGWSSWTKVISWGLNALGMANAIAAKSPAQFSMAFTTMLHDIGHGSVKEMDDAFLDSLQNDIDSLTKKLFDKIG